MNIFINISHPAHVHFFKNAVRVLSQRGHRIITGARKKEFTIRLLRSYEISHFYLTAKGRGFLGLLAELLVQQMKIANIIKRNKIDIMAQIGGIFNAPIGKFYGIPNLAFSDTENDKWGNKLSFALSKHVLSPSCFDHHTGGSWQNQVLYPGYHELAYLSPSYIPDRVSPEDRFFVRFVGWGAGHDIGEKGLSNEQKIEIVRVLEQHGSVHVSSEAPLPKEISEYCCRIDPSQVHDFMAKSKMLVGESATMASEAACLGIPAIFISNTGRGYTTEQDEKYGLIKHYRLDQWNQILQTLHLWASDDLYDEWQRRRRAMLKDKIDVTPWLVDLIERYPESIREAEKGSFERYYLGCAV